MNTQSTQKHKTENGILRMGDSPKKGKAKNPEREYTMSKGPDKAPWLKEQAGILTVLRINPDNLHTIKNKRHNLRTPKTQNTYSCNTRNTYTAWPRIRKKWLRDVLLGVNQNQHDEHNTNRYVSRRGGNTST